MDKQQMRMIYKKARNLFKGERREAAEKKIQETILTHEEFMLGTTVMVYLSTVDEVATDELIAGAFAQDKRVVIPYCKEDNTIGLAKITSLDDVEIGAFGIREPKKEFRDNISADEIDLVIVPGVTYDKKGNRLGMGKGFYDRFLAQVRPHSLWIALAFELQISEFIPRKKHDLPVDLIITEEHIYPEIEE